MNAIATVPCLYPDPDSYRPGAEPPEEWGEWRDSSGRCTHDHCIEGDQMARLYARTPHLSPDELAEMRADTELIRDEYAGVFRE